MSAWRIAVEQAAPGEIQRQEHRDVAVEGFQLGKVEAVQGFEPGRRLRVSGCRVSFFRSAMMARAPD